jgi:hypothetical protein
MSRSRQTLPSGQIDAVTVAVSYVCARDNARARVHFRNERVERKPAVAVLGVADLDAFGFPVFHTQMFATCSRLVSTMLSPGLRSKP